MASKLKRLLRGIHNRSIWRILVGYAAGSWVMLGASGTAMDVIGLPDWVPSFVFLICLMGLPLVLATALIQRTGSKAEPDRGDGDTRGLRRWLTWRRVSIAFGIAFGILAAGTSGYMGMRVMGIGPIGTLLAQGIFEAEERLILAQFEDRTAEGTLGETVTALLRIDLAQSPSILLLEQPQLAGALARMQQDPAVPLTSQVALELAQREGIKAVVVGEIITVGGATVIAARLLEANGGETLVASRETAGSGEEILEAVDRLSARLRERIGESLRSIHGDPPLQQVTTESLRALRMYAQAERANDLGDSELAVSLLEEAIAEDSTFGMAFRKLGIILNNQNAEPGQVKHAFTRAYEQREHVTVRERLLAEAAFHAYVGDDPQEAVLTYERLLDEYPSDPTALNNLGLDYLGGGRLEEAADLFLRSIRQGSAPAVTYISAVKTLFNLGQPDAAGETLERFRETLPDNPFVLALSASLASARFDYETAERFTRGLLDETGPEWQILARGQLANYAFIQGRPSEGIRMLLFAMDVQEQTGIQVIPQPRPILEGMTRAMVALVFHQDADEAVASLDQGLASLPLDGVPPEYLAHLEYAELYARAGELDQARDLLRAYEAEVPDETRQDPAGGSTRMWAQAAIAKAEGRDEEAVGLLREAVGLSREWGGCGICFLADLGEAFEEAALPDSAVRAYEEYLTTPDLYRFTQDSENLHRVLLGLGRSYEVLGRGDRALEYYTRLVDLWSEAEPALQPEVDVVRRTITRLQGGLPISPGSG